MASHVSTCVSMEKSIKGEGNQFVEEESNKKEIKEKKKRRKKEREREEREGGKEIGIPMVGIRWTKK